MTDFSGHCHCKQTEFTATLQQDQQAHILWYVVLLVFASVCSDVIAWHVLLAVEVEANHDTSHCNTCKDLSGSAYTLNQIIPAKALKITKGDDLGKYTYKGDSGKSVHCVRCTFSRQSLALASC